MLSFVIESDDYSVPAHMFCHQLIEAIHYNNWLVGPDFMSYGTKNGSFEFDEDIFKDSVPVGSVEYVTNFLEFHFNKTPKPINVPAELMKFEFTRRAVMNGTEKDITDKFFVKSNDKIKSFTAIASEAPIGNYQISEVVDFESEWRAFVYKQKLVGLQNYTGDFTLFPDVSMINQMIDQCESLPVAYTLDVGIMDGHTVVIEAHDFFAVGLYGFSDLRILPYMYSNWFNQYVGNI